MNIYKVRYNGHKVRYNGLWLGGIAIVAATCEDEAIQLVKEHPWTTSFTDVTVELVEGPVLFNDNGDY